uniref:Uncharacterized protein n=1 Tax=Denticeps clupeoides TaxID=299321 RepID=A0AAY4AIB8_9TELE
METPQLSPVLFLTFLFLTDMGCPVQGAMDSCYDENGNASRCMPKFENAAFNRSVTVSNVCGAPPEDYCMQTGSTRSCHQCESANPNHHHNATYLTDFHIDDEPTWWQSQSMFYGIQYPTSVNLTLHLGKAYEITYVHLKFYTSRPESFAIYKRTQEDGPWLPYQYYSASCGKTYGRNTRSYIRPGGDEREALCTDEFSDISPLTGGNVAFSTLEGRPSAYNFDQSPVLQDWVTATDLMISLDRLNTFGDEFFKDAKVLRSYFYAISDFSVGGRCKCNGHASECVLSDEGKPVCVCEHNTAGADCHLCAPFYQNRPWARATADSANQCVMCNCSDHADTCVFDPEQYRRSGSGGRCVGCRDNTDGAHCEHCRSNFFRRHLDHVCSNCSCNAMGSVSLQCDEQGVCVCRDNVMGQKCDACKPGHHSLSPGGCSLCECDGRGSVGVCSSGDGHCYCKTNVEGHSCNRCKPGSFNLQQEDPDGCQTCFCFGHSLACTSSYQYRPVNITSDFLEGTDGWVGEFSGGLEVPLLWKEGEVYLLPYNELDQGFYKAPEKFMGDQLLSYRQALWLHFTAESEDLLPQTLSVFLEGSGYSVVATLVAQSHHLPSAAHSPQHIFTLRYLPPLEFISASLRQTKGKYTRRIGDSELSIGLSGVTLASAAHVPAGSEGVGAALWVEQCSCPLGLTGQFCERCAPGFTRETPNGGPLSTCVPCNCNQHGDCHPETGVCHCADFTTGPTCEHCLDGYYGNAMIGTSGDCRPCPCPDQTSCAQTPETGDVVCTHCPPGTRGTRCEFCEDGSYGDPLGQRGPIWQCEPCKCHGNVDVNDVGVCDHMTGRCLKCLGHTEGDHCERCQRGYYGNAVDPTRLYPKCKPCRCSPEGTSGSLEYCHPDTGDCLCLSYVTGRDCSQCQPGFFNLLPGLGCERCNCNPIGSTTPACDSVTGQCFCRTGVDGQSCDHCHVGFFGFSSRGCRGISKPCNCDPMGSISMQCHDNGTCSCRQGFVGYKCDKCQLNFYHNRETYQCEECPVCYGLVRDQAASMKAKLLDLEKLLSNYDCRNSRGRLYPWHSSQWRENHLPELQGEDYLPNAIEDFLAIQGL